MNSPITADDLHHDLSRVVSFLQEEAHQRTSPSQLLHPLSTPFTLGNVALDPSQARAANHLYGPMRVMAPAGSGKTRTLVSRIVNLLNYGIPGERILALAFNRKAQQEMNDRLSDLGVTSVNVRTFHSFGYEIVRNALGWEYDAKTSHSRLESLLRSAIARHVFTTRLRLDSLDPFLTALHCTTMELVPLKDINVPLDIREIPFEPIFQDFLTAQIQQKLLNFEGMLYHALRALIDQATLRQHLQDQFEFILVDEFQDLNHAQMLLVQIIALPHNNLFVVGDDDQMIYAWRGADVRLILDFPTTYPGAESVVLGTNYRSAKKIVRHSRRLIEHNPERVAKDIQPRNGAGRGTIDILLAHGLRFQAKATLEWMQTQKVVHNLAWDNFAVLYRANAHIQPFISLLSQQGIPYTLGPETQDEEDLPPEPVHGAVNLMTIHKAKGKEFPWVIYFNLSRSGAAEIETNIAEERRVAYVAATRAQTGLLITAEQDRPSRFLSELALHPAFDDYALPYLNRQADIARKKRDKLTHRLSALAKKQTDHSKLPRLPWWPRRGNTNYQEHLNHQMTELGIQLEEMEDRVDELETEIRFREILKVKKKYEGE